MIFTCPFCGPRAHDEFTYRGDADAKRPAIGSGDTDGVRAFIFDRANPAGPHREIWNHTGGCRTHLVVTRDTVSHDVLACEPVGPFADHLKGEAS